MFEKGDKIRIKNYIPKYEGKRGNIISVCDVTGTEMYTVEVSDFDRVTLYECEMEKVDDV